MSSFIACLKLLSNLFIYPVVYILNFFIKIDTRLFCFSSRNLDSFSDNPKYVFMSLSKERKVRCYWLTKNRTIYSYLKNLKLNVVFMPSLKALWLILRTKYFIGSCTNVVPWGALHKGKKVIQMWHGSPIKKLGRLRIRETLEEKLDSFYISRCDYFISPADFFSETLSKCYNIQKKKFLLTGNPRNDILFVNQDRQRIMELLKVDGRLSIKKILLYCPTFRDDFEAMFFPFDDFDSVVLGKYLKDNEALCIIRNHTFDSMMGANKLLSIERVVEAPSSEHRIDVQELLSIADILVTDYSSIYFDFLLLDRPIIFVPVDLEEYEKTRGFLFNYQDNVPGLMARDFTTFIQAIDSSLRNPEQFSQKRRDVNHRFNYFKDNLSTERVVEFLCGLTRERVLKLDK